MAVVAKILQFIKRAEHFTLRTSIEEKYYSNWRYDQQLLTGLGRKSWDLGFSYPRRPRSSNQFKRALWWSFWPLPDPFWRFLGPLPQKKSPIFDDFLLPQNMNLLLLVISTYVATFSLGDKPTAGWSTRLCEGLILNSNYSMNLY